MTLLDLIQRETAGSRRRILIVATLSGISNAALLAILNKAIGATSSDGQSLRYLVMFAIAFALYAICFRKTFNLVSEVLEEIVAQLRVRIADKIRRAELSSLETVDQGEIYNLLTSEARVISDSGSILAAALQSAVLLTFASLYLAVLSIPAFLFCFVLIGGVLPKYMKRLGDVNVSILRTYRQEVQAFNTIRDLLDGFKEVKLNEARSRELMADIAESAVTLRSMKVTTADMFNVNYLMAYGAFYVMMAAVMFLLPRLVSIAHADMVQVMMTVLFIVGPLGAVVQGIQSLSKANASVQNMVLLEQRLDRFTETLGTAAAPVTVSREPREIRLTLGDGRVGSADGCEDLGRGDRAAGGDLHVGREPQGEPSKLTAEGGVDEAGKRCLPAPRSAQ